MNAVVDGLEALLIEAHKTKGWAWVSEEALWVTWSLEKFGTRPIRRLNSNNYFILFYLSVFQFPPSQAS